MKKTIMILATVLFPLLSYSSEFEGTIKEVQVSPGSSPVRVSIFVGPRGSECTGSGGNWYAYENGDIGIGKIWTSAVVTAYAATKTVKIAGTDTCDEFGIEGVSYLHLK